MDETYDVVVVGGGGTGLAAAIAARDAGRSVLLLEKQPKLGGTTGMSVGSITATNTPHQRRAGIKDRPQDHFADMPGFAAGLADRDNESLRRLLTENVTDTVQWLIDLGLVFYGPMPEPPHRKPRMHNVLPNSRAYIHTLGRHARRKGVVIREGVRVRELLRDGDEADARVIGVRVETLAGERRFGARGGVVLASGDIAAAVDLKARYMPADKARVDAINPANTGDGQQMGLALGGRVLNGDLTLGPEIRFLPPPQGTFVRRLPPWRPLALFMAWAMDHMPQALLRPFVMSFVTTWLAPSPELYAQGAVLINRDGARFTDELDKPAYTLPDQPDKVGYILLDKTVADKFSSWPYYISTAPGVAYAYLDDYRRNRKDVFHRDATLGGLAAKIGVDAAALERAVAEHNTALTTGGTSGGANAPARPPIETPPFTALGPVRSAIIIAEGGLAVNARLQVLGAGDAPIPGLYAAGSAGQGGLLLEGHGHHLGWTFTSGRMAGRHAAHEVVTEDLPG